MAGWDLKNGIITEYNVSEDYIWSLFNYVFSDSSKKRNTYKFGLIKSLLDNVFNGVKTEFGVVYSYEEIFSKFAENYWNLVVKYNLRQMRRDGKSEISKVEKIIKDNSSDIDEICLLEFESIDEQRKTRIINEVTKECKRVSASKDSVTDI